MILEIVSSLVLVLLSLAWLGYNIDKTVKFMRLLVTEWHQDARNELSKFTRLAAQSLAPKPLVEVTIHAQLLSGNKLGLQPTTMSHSWNPESSLECVFMPQRVIRVTKVTYQGPAEYALTSVMIGQDNLASCSGLLFTSIEHPITCELGRTIVVRVAKRDSP